MKRRNMREVRRCNGGQRRVILGVSGLVLAVALLAGTPAHATSRTRIAGDLGFPKHITWHAQDRTPPLRSLLRVFVLIHVNQRPQQFSARVSLYKFRLVMTKKGPKWEGKRAPNAPTARVGLGDIPSPGQNVTWKFGGGIYPDWLCATGRYFITMAITGISSGGSPESYLLYAPYLKGHDFQGSAFGTRPPDYAEGTKFTKC